MVIARLFRSFINDSNSSESFEIEASYNSITRKEQLFLLFACCFKLYASDYRPFNCGIISHKNSSHRGKLTMETPRVVKLSSNTFVAVGVHPRYRLWMSSAPLAVEVWAADLAIPRGTGTPAGCLYRKRYPPPERNAHAMHCPGIRTNNPLVSQARGLHLSNTSYSDLGVK